MALTLAWVLTLGAPVSAAPGDLDTSFSGDGRQVVDLGGSEEAYAVAIRPNGKILIVGTTNAGGDSDFLIVQLEEDGDLDASFGGGDGVVTTDFFGGYDSAYALTLLGSGKFLVAGQATDGQGKSRFAVARYRASGALDANFAKGGRRTVRFGKNVTALAIVRLPDGSMVLVGRTYSPGSNFALARLTKGGSLVKAFGRKGRVTTDFGGRDDFASTAIRRGKRILVAGGSAASFSEVDVALARYRFGGRLDERFGHRGKRRVSMIPSRDWANDLILLPSGRFVVVTYALNDIGLARFRPNGILDSDFGGGDGKVLADFGGNEAGAALVRAGTKLVVAGSSDVSGSYDSAVFRFRLNGGVDGGFGSGGFALVGGPPSNTAWGVALQDSKIVTAGYSETVGGDLVAARFLG